MKIAPYRNLRWTLCALALLIGAAQAWLSRYQVSNDSVSYLDMGNYFFQGRLAEIVNGIWSPLEAFLFGLTVAILKPNIRTEYPVIHLLIFLFFVFTAASFDFFLRQLLELRDLLYPIRSRQQSDWPWIVICYAIFIWSSLGLIGAYETNPDMLVAGCFYLACGLIVRMATGRAGWMSYVGLGLALGAGYLTKAIMFPVSLLILGSAFLIAKRSLPRVLVACGVFGLAVIPFMIALSVKEGHPTFGETGGYNYQVHVDGLPRHHWQGGNPIYGRPAHPTREIFAAPPTFEFKTPVPGTYPVWYDPVYWYQGAKARYRLLDQFQIFIRNLSGEFQTFFYALNGVLMTAMVLAFCAVQAKTQVLRNLGRLWFLAVPSILACISYALVHYELRYVGGFFGVLAIVSISAMIWADENENSRLFCGVAALATILVVWTLGYPLRHLGRAWTSELGSDQDIAQGAVDMGLRPGDPIASLVFANLDVVKWAHLARLQVIAESYYWPAGLEGSNTSYWSLDRAKQKELLNALSQTGARAVVSSEVPVGSGASEWTRIGSTGYYLHWFNGSMASARP